MWCSTSCPTTGAIQVCFSEEVIYVYYLSCLFQCISVEVTFKYSWLGLCIMLWELNVLPITCSLYYSVLEMTDVAAEAVNGCTFRSWYFCCMALCVYKQSYAGNDRDGTSMYFLHYVCICSQNIFVILCFVNALQGFGLLNIVQCYHYCDNKLGNDCTEWVLKGFDRQ